MTAEETEHFQIGEVAAATELSVKTIRHYDDVGLVAPSARSAGGFRLYTRTDIDRLLVIRRMKPLGFTLDDMRALLAAQDTLALPGAHNHERHAALSIITEFRGRAEEACRKLERQVEYARELTAQLADQIGAKQRS
ncbi:MerR family transcriptional regulator [Gordonia westfalica]|uniref:MerR family transcriptional regulator n=1 Tax=Gordonia westfalica TaxID=158898 RepID=A0ABU2GY39_9ACTN|nr:MerR family transcriptional regulator [Gordonia westfalica]MDS1116375.1 MerR family transcriptional regulator [Gordonia westfalica]